MIYVDITIEGVTPLLMNRFHEESQEEATSKVHSRREALTPEEDASKRLYKDEHGTIYMPGENLRQSIIAAAGRHKIGRKSAAYDLAAAVYVQPEAMEFIGEWVVDSRPVVIPATRGRIMRHRPKFMEWRVNGTLVVDEQLVDTKLVRRVLDDAGRFTGLCDYRPAKRGFFGRFVVSHWQVQERDK